MNITISLYYIGKINERLAEMGYSHKVHYDYNQRQPTRIHLTFVDENNYPFREFGNLTQDKAERFLEGLYFGLQIGLLNKPIE